MLGLDIGSAAVKFVELASGRHGPVLLRSGVIATPAGTVVDGQIVKPDELGRVIQDALRRAGCRTQRAACAVNGSSLLLRLVELPPLPPTQLKSSLRWELERYVPYSAEAVEYDVQPLDMLPDKVVALLATAPRATIVSLLTTLERARLIPEVLEPGPLALLRFIRSHLSSAAGADPVLVLDLGAFSVKVLVQNKGRLEFARTILLGEFGTGEGAWERVVGEIRRSADYFFLQHRLGTPHFSTCLCAGGLVEERAFLGQLEAGLGIPVRVVGLSESNQAAGHLLATAAGLALGEV
ncbi:MAG: type pilus assembly protein PilM [Bacillota bacterium]|jgi:type IV pilus assembly protein PilM|nr:type pilus assembly protein PilM [Bacillota bacterium]MDK2926291.1 type pilus assembly protein PilM [Bacillota bacterium]